MFLEGNKIYLNRQGEKTIGKRKQHADLIKAWADGCDIQYRKDADSNWVDSPDPAWVSDYEYRIKPVEPERVYPETKMHWKELERIFDPAPTDQRKDLMDVANAALRHAIDHGQVVTREEFDRAIGYRKARDLAVAQAAQEAAIRRFLDAPVGYGTRAIREADLAAIIAEVK